MKYLFYLILFIRLNNNKFGHFIWSNMVIRLNTEGLWGWIHQILWSLYKMKHIYTKFPTSLSPPLSLLLSFLFVLFFYILFLFFHSTSFSLRLLSNVGFLCHVKAHTWLKMSAAFSYEGNLLSMAVSFFRVKTKLLVVCKQETCNEWLASYFLFSKQNQWIYKLIIIRHRSKSIKMCMETKRLRSVSSNFLQILIKICAAKTGFVACWSFVMVVGCRHFQFGKYDVRIFPGPIRSLMPSLGAKINSNISPLWEILSVINLLIYF